MVINFSNPIKTVRFLWILLIFLLLTFLASLVAVIQVYYFFSSEIIEGIHKFEQYRIDGFKIGFYIGANCSLLITIIFSSIVWVSVRIRKEKTRKTIKGKSYL